MMGRVWKFGDGIDTDLLAPGAYMKGPVEELAKHCLESVDPKFAAHVGPGDIVVAGRNFGIGSSREQAAQALKILGVSAVVARSFGGIFYRNAFNLGLPALVCEAADSIETGHEIELNPAAGRLFNRNTEATLTCDAVPAHLLEIVALGGLVPYLEQRFRRTG
ncbi:MAG: 3-isopropylmalate dehydratase [Alphaproteobacteria bacterium]|nr:3-isopropylmalate dehydratase [Alphaproteobacteria bacterium]